MTVSKKCEADILRTLESVANDLVNWRQTRVKKGPVPNDLRAKISTLSHRYRVPKIIAALSLNTAQLKAFTKGSPPKNRMSL